MKTHLKQTIHLQVKSLCYKNQQHQILNKISFDVERGDIIGILGPNGAGKSTLLRCLYRYLMPNQGKVLLNNQDITHFSRKQFASKVAVVLQHPPSGFAMTTRQLLATGLFNKHKWWQLNEHDDEKKTLDSMLHRMKLIHKADSLFNLLSGGEKQRLLIGRALLQQPEILLLDEPTNHLDIKYQLEVLSLIKSLNITVITTLHDLNIASEFCNKLLFLQDGKLVKMGFPKQIVTPKLIKQVYGVNTLVKPHPISNSPHISYEHQEFKYGVA
ncbi:ABC transporter ATP-binding protein [Shewanella maritima]|uniref:ABC transporter ATP-binding protein n=1 Tax=Shewanella maritima TaxID=2520507 RepID=UPI0037367E3C